MMDRTVDVIREGEIIRMPESRAIEEDLFILRRVIEPAEEPVYETTFRKKSEEQQSRILQASSRLESWKAGKSSYKRNNVVKDLIDSFHWEIARVRRSRDMSRKQLAESIGVTEEEIKMIEFGELPSDDFVLVNKIENKLGISLRKEKKPDEVNLAELQRAQGAKEEKARREAEKIQRKSLEEEGLSGEDIELVE